MMRLLAFVFFAFALGCAPLAAFAQPMPPQPQPGMQFTGTLGQSVTSKSANVGDRVTLTDVHSTDGSITGATMYGQVASVQKAGQGRPASIQLQFNTLVLPGGASYPVEGEVTQLQVNTANNGAKEAGGTIAGMIVGNILGKWIGTNLGGAVGAAGGYIIAHNSREDVTVPANSSVNVRLVQPHPQQQQPPQYPYPAPPPPPAPQVEATPLPR